MEKHMKVDEGFLARMRDSFKLLQSDGPMAATAAIQSALRGEPLSPEAEAQSQKNQEHQGHQGHTDGLDSGVGAGRFAKGMQEKWAGLWDKEGITDLDFHDILNSSLAGTPAPAADVDGDTTGETDAAKGRFVNATFTNAAGTRAYKVYIPSAYTGQALPVLVMLHGCKQNPDDFAAGTAMNTVAEENDCIVVYPAQARGANGSNCWNWFQKGDQQRDRGEPSIIAGITQEVVRQYGADPSRCYIAGLSAGGAMAAIMSARYPDLYAAVGIHSGLPLGAAHDVPSAFAAMKSSSPTFEPPPGFTPTIVFHGDRDKTVHPANGAQAFDQGVPRVSKASSPAQADPAVTVNKGTVPRGRSYSTTVRRDASGKPVAEYWVIHGAGHAWSGGSRKGSYTDPKGPDASSEMLRFFYQHALKPEVHH
jgi:poly(hydroxyalkanoate) depolymerase family esterase